MSLLSKKILFNFSASINGGGLKRLEEYSKWFNEVGGSSFIVSSKVIDNLTLKYPKNRYFISQQNNLDRLFRDQKYLKDLPLDYTNLELYYSYGIPIYSKIAKKNWFHISNVAPFAKNINKSIKDYIRNPILKHRFIRYLDKPDFISTESLSSFRYLPSKYEHKFVCLLNGSDDEISNFKINQNTGNYAVAVGTQPYKRIDRVIRCFHFLKEDYGLDKLLIYGCSKKVNRNYFKFKDIKFMGSQPRNSVIKSIASSKFYISCTTIENSFNAASEGIFLSSNSLISDIGPHKELLMNENKEYISINDQKMFLIKKEALKCKNIISWDSVIKIMLTTSGIEI